VEKLSRILWAVESRIASQAWSYGRDGGIAYYRQSGLSYVDSIDTFESGMTELSCVV